MDGYGRKSERIAGEVRAAILAGRHRPGERIESENELAARYQVSRQTVRKALAALIGQGYLRAEHGRGTFVTERSRPGSKTIAVVITYLAEMCLLLILIVLQFANISVHTRRRPAARLENSSRFWG